MARRNWNLEEEKKRIADLEFASMTPEQQKKALIKKIDAGIRKEVRERLKHRIL